MAGRTLKGGIIKSQKDLTNTIDIDEGIQSLQAGSGITITNPDGPIPTISATGSGGTVTTIYSGSGITVSPYPITGSGSVSLQVPVTVANGGTGSTGPYSSAEIVIIDGTGAMTTTGSTSIINPTFTTVTAVNLIGDLSLSVTNNITALGTNQSSGYTLTAGLNIIVAGAVGAGVVLPVIIGALDGLIVGIINLNATAIFIYPPVGAAIGAAGVNVGLLLAAGAAVLLGAATISQYYTFCPPIIAGAGLGLAYGNMGTTVSLTTPVALSSGGTGTGTLAGGQLVATNSGGTALVALTSSTNPTFAGLLTANIAFTATTGIAAAGSSQGTATALLNSLNVVTSVGAGAGVALPTATLGFIVVVVNNGANALKIYPASGAQIDAAGANVAVTLAVNTVIIFQASSSTQWITIQPPAVAGSGISITPGNGGYTIGNTGLLSASVGTGLSSTGGQNPTLANTGVLTVAAGTGITSSGGQNPSIANTGLLSLGVSTGISSTGGQNPTIANTGVLTVTGSTGITSSGGQNPSITNTGVTSLLAGTAIGVSGATGAVTVSNTGVTSWPELRIRLQYQHRPER